MRNPAQFALACCLVLSACKTTTVETPTQTLVIVDAEAGVQAATDKLRVEVQPVDDGSEPYNETFSSAGGNIEWPRVLALAPRDGDADRTYEVVATALDSTGGFVGQVRALSGYTEGKRILLVLLLDDRCIGVACGEDETCSAGRCGDAQVDPTTLEQFRGDDIDELDLAGFSRRGEDAGMDGGADAARDVEVVLDAGSDASTDAGDAGDAGDGGPCMPDEEICNDKDDDCDDTIDEKLQRSCGTNEGVCKDGNQTCTAGAWGLCKGQITGGAEVCDGLDNDCDGDKDNGATCNPNLFAAIESAACMGGKCVITGCDANTEDCDGEFDTGCERPIDTMNDCGGCDDACLPVTGTVVDCVGGNCMNTGCMPGAGNCDGDLTDGCEILGGPPNCGACGENCVVANTTQSCQGASGARMCVITNCAIPGEEDCDMVASNGCEEQTNAATDHCGACDNDCENKPNVDSATCIGGVCAPVCSGTFLDCFAGMPGCETDGAVSAPHCSSCFNDCRAHPGVSSATCSSSACNYVCSGTLDDCTAAIGCETDTADSAAHCGACNNACNTHSNQMGGATCSGSSCSYMCDAFFGDCTVAPGCETDLRDTDAHCGACNYNCDAHPNAANGVCGAANCGYTCIGPFDDCTPADGCETNLDTTTAHCGACNNDCTLSPNVLTAHCATGGCIADSCSGGFNNCDGDDTCETPGPCPSMDAGVDAGIDAGIDAGVDAGTDGGMGLPSYKQSILLDNTNGPSLSNHQVRLEIEGTGTPIVPPLGEMCGPMQLHDGHIYFFCAQTRAWSQARDICRAAGMNLVRIDDGAEDAFVEANHPGSFNMWMAGNDQGTEGDWLWADDGARFWNGGAGGNATCPDGTSCVYGSNGGLFTNWRAGDPTQGLNENCLSYASAGGWRDLDCSLMRGYACESDRSDLSASFWVNVNMKGDGIRFFDSDGTPLSYWLEQFDSLGQRAVIWIQVPSIPAYNAKLLTIEYGTGLAAASDIGATMDWGDDFESGALSGAVWNTANATVAPMVAIECGGGSCFNLPAGELQMVNKGSPFTGRLRGTPTVMPGTILETRTNGMTMSNNGVMLLGQFLGGLDGLGIWAHAQCCANDDFWNDGGWEGLIGSTTPGQWSRQTLRWNGPYAHTRSQLEDATIHYSTTYETSTGSGPVTLGIGYDDIGQGEALDIRWDWILARKYASPEPQLFLNDDETDTTNAGQIYFSDDFNRAGGSNAGFANVPPGSEWMDVTGDAGLIANALSAYNSGDVDAQATHLTPLTYDGTRLRYKVRVGNNNNCATVAFNAMNLTPASGVAVRVCGSVTDTLDVLEGGALRASTGSIGLIASTDYFVEAIITGTKMIVIVATGTYPSLGGTSVASLPDVSLMGSEFGSDTMVQIDDVSALSVLLDELIIDCPNCP